jgi:hypothetical protein
MTLWPSAESEASKSIYGSLDDAQLKPPDFCQGQVTNLLCRLCGPYSTSGIGRSWLGTILDGGKINKGHTSGTWAWERSVAEICGLYYGTQVVPEKRREQDGPCHNSEERMPGTNFWRQQETDLLRGQGHCSQEATVQALPFNVMLLDPSQLQ